MRTLTLTITMFALVSLGGVAFAQQGTEGAPAKATPIEKTRIEILLTDGTRVECEVPLSETAKIAELSKPAIAGGQNQHVATLVYGMTIEVDAKGEAVILTPRSRSGALEPLAIPISGANLLVKTLQTKIFEAKAIAAKHRKQRKQL
jgi:hypothetical protein